MDLLYVAIACGAVVDENQKVKGEARTAGLHSEPGRLCYWVGTVGKIDGNIIAVNSMGLYQNAAPNAAATFAARTIFYQ